MKVLKFENTIWELEGVRIVVRAPDTAEIDDYKFTRRADKGMNVTAYLRGRIKPSIGPYEAVVVCGDGSLPHSRTNLNRVRETYQS